MDPDSFQVIVELEVQEFSGIPYPMIMLNLPSDPMSLLEVLTYDPKKACLRANSNVLELLVDGVLTTTLTKHNDKFEDFCKLLEKTQVFGMSFMISDEDNTGEPFILFRTIMIENNTGNILANAGPRRMSFQDACKVVATVSM